MNDAAAFERDAAVFALRDYDFRAVEMVFSQLVGNIADVREPITDGEPRLGRVDANVIRPAIPSDQIVAKIGTVALGIHRQKSRFFSQGADR